MTGQVFVDTNVFAYRIYTSISKHLETAVEKAARVRSSN